MKERQGRSQWQSGSLYCRGKSWVGRWRQYAKNGKATYRSTVLGAIASMDEDEARVKLSEVIKANAKRHVGPEYLGKTGVVSINERISRTSIGVRAQTVGAAAELAVCTDLLMKGVEVFRPMHNAAEFDLVAYVENHFLRVEVKAGTVTEGWANCDIRRNWDKFDVLAVVTPNDGIFYAAATEVGRAGTRPKVSRSFGPKKGPNPTMDAESVSGGL